MADQANGFLVTNAQNTARSRDKEKINGVE